MSSAIKSAGLKNISDNTMCRHSDIFQYSLSKLTLSAKRVLFLILAQIDNPIIKPKDDELIFNIKASEFASLCGLSPENNIYTALERGVSDLSKSFVYEDVSEGALGRIQQTNITSRVIYHYNEAYCSVKINRDVYPYFFELSKSFTKNNVREVLRIPEKVLFNFYQVIMKRYSKSDLHEKYKREFIISIDDLKDEMWLFTTDNKGKNKEYKYPVYADLGKLLTSLCKGLDKYTSFKNPAISIAEKKGRKATHLKISYMHQADIDKQIEKEKTATEENDMSEKEKALRELIARSEQELLALK